jgi:hypothetical protein
MPRKSVSGRKTFTESTSTNNQTVLEKNSVEDAETVDITDVELLAALGYQPTADQFLNDFRVIRVPVLAADAANEAAAAAVVFGVNRNAGDDGFTVEIGVPTTGLIADTKFVRIRVVTA